MKVQAKLARITEGWHGNHHRKVGVLEIQTKDSPFVGGTLILEEEGLRDLEVGGLVVIEVTPVTAAAGAVV